MAFPGCFPGPRYQDRFSGSQSPHSRRGFFVLCTRGELLLNPLARSNPPFLRRNSSDYIGPTLRLLLGLQFEGFLTEIKAGLTRALPTFILDLPLRSEFSDARDWLRQQYPNYRFSEVCLSTLSWESEARFPSMFMELIHIFHVIPRQAEAEFSSYERVLSNGDLPKQQQSGSCAETPKINSTFCMYQKSSKGPLTHWKCVSGEVLSCH